MYYVGFAADGWTKEARQKAEEVARAGRPSRRASNRWDIAGVCLMDLDDVDRDLAQWTV